VGELVERFLATQEVDFPGRAKKARYSWDARMCDKFSHIDAHELQGHHTLDYIQWAIGVKVKRWKPIAEPLAKATANRDVAVLQGAYTYAKKAMNFTHRPHFHTHDESDNVREGFLEQGEFDRIAAVIREMGPEYLWLRGFATMAYECGNRRSELQTLRVGQFNKVERIVPLKGIDTKSGKPRELGLSDELYQLLTACCAGKSPSDHSFTRRCRIWRSEDRTVRPIGDFRKLWRTVLRKAGIERDVFLHDFRRSMVNNMIQSGCDRDQVRQYTGHSVSGMHEMISRYHITQREEILDAARKNEERKLRERETAAELVANRSQTPEIVM
jgi:integrase